MSMDRDLKVAALLCERWGLATFQHGVRAHVPEQIDNGDGSFRTEMVIITPELLACLVARLRAPADRSGVEALIAKLQALQRFEHINHPNMAKYVDADELNAVLVAALSDTRPAKEPT